MKWSGFETWFDHIFTVRPCESHFTALELQFLAFVKEGKELYLLHKVFLRIQRVILERILKMLPNVMNSIKYVLMLFIKLYD